MSELNLPANPQAGDTYDYDSKRYLYDGIKWTTIKFVGETAISLMGNHKSGTKEHPVSAIDWQGQIGHRNLLINGDFRICQRGTSSATNNSYTFAADRWRVWSSASTSFNASFKRTDGRTLLVATPLAPSQFEIAQNIESTNVEHLTGKTVTFSVEIHTQNGAPNASLTLYSPKAGCDDWSGGSNLIASIPVNVGIDSVVGIKRFSLTTTLTNADVRNGLSVAINSGAGATGYFAVSEAQLEVGPVATPFEHRPYGYELSLCQRYCVAVQSISVASDVIGIGGYTTGSGSIAQYFLPVQMRAVPKWAGGGVLSIVSAGGGISPVTLIDMRGSTLTLDTSGANQTNVAGQSCVIISMGASAGFRGFDAEL